MPTKRTITFLAPLLFLVQLARAQQQLLGDGIAHPAAGPNLAQPGLARTLLDKALLPEFDSNSGDSLIGPEGQEILAPVKRHQERFEEVLAKDAAEVAEVLKDEKSSPVSYAQWLAVLLGCAAVACCGVLPVLFLPENATAFLESEAGRHHLHGLLAFAVGSLLGDVFLHLLAEVWAQYSVDMPAVGMCTISGFLVFLVVEKLGADSEESQHRMAAWLNLGSNLVDNFTHGLAVGGSFLVSFKFGVLTTAAIVLHEVPHEVSDFALLLRANIARSTAVKAQLLTAVGGLAGAICAVWLHANSCEHAGHIGQTPAASWILPFTAGGFLNIALCQILPELMQETDARRSLSHLFYIILGVLTMAAVGKLHI